LRRIGQAMGLFDPPPITRDQQRRSYITVIRRNWHLLPYEQLLQLLGWTPEQMAFTLREDDFLFVKLGNLKPLCEPIRYAPPSANVLARERAIAAKLREAFPAGLTAPADPLFGFVSRLSAAPTDRAASQSPSRFTPRYCYSYFALYGDPLLDGDAAYPDGYLGQLAAVGVNGVWLQAVLHKLAPFPWDPTVSSRHEERLAHLAALVKRAGRQGVGVYLYLNEPRAMPVGFYRDHPELKGVVEDDYAALCTSHPDVQQWLSSSIASIGRAVPNLAGFFTITASENLSNCWSHNHGEGCSRCRERSASEVIAQVNRRIYDGIRQSGAKTQLIAWDWGWADAWAQPIIEQLPKEVALMSVSEWSTPIQRGGIKTQVGEYSISTIGPGPRARRHWDLAEERGLRRLAKIQAGNTWELSAVPYIPALENVAQHAANLLQANVDGLMLGWTLGGYPSPNLEVVMEVARRSNAGQPPTGSDTDIVAQALQRVAHRRFGPLGSAVVQAWRTYSAAFREFPFDGGLVYNAPMQFGPSNLLWPESTGYHATMIGFPYDDLNGWRGPYPPETFIQQFEKVADGFEQATRQLTQSAQSERAHLTSIQQTNLDQELTVAEASAIHLRSTANQARFVLTRRTLLYAKTSSATNACRAELERVLRSELALAQRLYDLQSRDSRLGFEASNQYYYVPLDLVEKILNCRYLLDHSLPL
jgi:hypothetical protein